MQKILYEAELMMTLKKSEFLGNNNGRLREVLERLWIDKFKWGKQISCFKVGMYDDLIEKLEELGFHVFYDTYYGERMFCVSLR
jgi:hypothetical protein